MRLEDALFCVVLAGDAGDNADVVERSRALIDGGVDMLRLPTAYGSSASEVAAVCRDEDALLILEGDAAGVVHADAAGVHLAQGDLGVPQARVTVGDDRLVGISTASRDEIILGLEVGADYLVHEAGALCAADFCGFRDQAGIPFFAGGMKTLDEASVIVESGIYRLCVQEAVLDSGDLREGAAVYSRLLGRCI